MNSRSKKQIIGGLMVLVFASTALFAQGEEEFKPVHNPHLQGQKRHMMRGPGKALMRRLDLNEEQAKKVEELQKTKMKKAVRVRAEMAVKQAEMRLLWLDEKPDKTKLMAKNSEIQKIKGSLEEANIDFRLAVNEILTPDQRAAFAHFCNQRQGRQGRKGRMAGMKGRMRKMRQMAGRHHRMGRRGQRGRRGRQGRQGQGQRRFRRQRRFETLRNNIDEAPFDEAVISHPNEESEM